MQKNKNLNVFNSGLARKAVAEEISKSWPGCTNEIIRSKLRNPLVLQDLTERGIQGMFISYYSFFLTYFIDTRKKYSSSSDVTDSIEEQEEQRSIEVYEQHELPPDNLLRPPPVTLPGISVSPEGWKLKIPPNIYQVYKVTGYQVQAQHTPGDQFITLIWTLIPPSWEEMQKYRTIFPNADWTNDTVKQQVFFIYYLFFSL